MGTDPTVCDELCGDGLRVGDELTARYCDDRDNHNGDGCSDVCAVEFGFDCTGTPSLCEEDCGDGHVVGVEVCDGANLDGFTDCTDLGYAAPGTLACLPDCSDYDTAGCAPICGNGHVEPGEGCDDGDTTGGDGCSNACAVETGWQCAGAPSVCSPICGNNLIHGAEQCDGTELNGVDCTDYDYHNAVGLLCLADCSGFNPAGCSSSCGNVVEPGEGCDQGNVIAGDGCSATCSIEANWSCTATLGTTSVCSCLNNEACPVGRRCDTGTGACYGVNGDNCSGVYPAVAVTNGHNAVYDNTHLATAITGYMVNSTLVPVNGPDMFFSISVPNGQFLVVEVTENTFDASIALLSACPATNPVTPTRFANRNGAGAMEQLHFQSPSNGTYYIVVQGMTALDEGSFRLKVYQSTLTAFGKNERLIINEFMPNPTGADGYREWIEIKSFSDTRNFNLRDDKININGTSYTINEDVIIRYGQLLMLAGSTDSTQNGGLDTVVWAWGAANVIPDAAGTLSILVSNNDVCDEVTYSASWPIAEGASVSLDPDHGVNVNAKTLNDTATNWCSANDDGTPPDMTPWDFNDQCP